MTGTRTIALATAIVVCTGAIWGLYWLPVRAVAEEYLIWAALTPMIGALAFVMDGVYIGATWSRDMRNMMLLSALAALAVWAIAVPVIGNHGLWLAICVFLGARGITLSWRLSRRQTATFAAH